MTLFEYRHLFAKVHNYIGNVLMALNALYAFLAASISDLLTGVGFAILLAKFSASSPLNTGVSLIGRAMTVLLLFVIRLQRHNKFLIYRVLIQNSLQT